MPIWLASAIVQSQCPQKVGTVQVYDPRMQGGVVVRRNALRKSGQCKSLSQTLERSHIHDAKKPIFLYKLTFDILKIA